MAPRRLHSGRYRIVEPLGEPGSAVVGAYDTVLERRVAIKILQIDRDTPAGLLAREARILAAIQHPNVVSVYALHEHDDPPFLVMEWIDGDPLAVVLRERVPTLRKALGQLRQIADGLDAIHRAGLIHGDIKPANIILGRDARLRIVDVGLVPRLERMEPGEVLGTPAYMPPERVRGTIPTPELAPRCDVYSFAILAFEFLTGRLPFRDEPRGTRPGARATARALRPTDVPPLTRVLEEVLARGMAERPASRPASAGALVDALERAAMALDASGEPLRILVVDDEEDTRVLLSSALAIRLRGALVETASDGEAALESIRRRTPSAVILDLTMPGLTGLDVLSAIRTASTTLPVLVCTGHGSGPERQRARDLGVEFFFVKPVGVDEIIGAIRALVDAPTRPRRARGLIGAVDGLPPAALEPPPPSVSEINSVQEPDSVQKPQTFVSRQ